ncbi:hypothetical protein BB559_004555 [Furculomyces boomerangus]|uniref:Uncharacterized protein n=2 Tax=Harpellales TaxID=61421 RepID=A0A2T9YE93_9FUNG|nr:hypothetical protein BB559_004555 [Furculomyces boomerangus]PWA01409.1 hypothetical protein BB558_002493 [Smittium angustum]
MLQTIDNGTKPRIVSSYGYLENASKNKLTSHGTRNSKDIKKLFNFFSRKKSISIKITPNIVQSGSYPNIVQSGSYQNIVQSGSYQNIVQSGSYPNIVQSGLQPNITIKNNKRHSLYQNVQSSFVNKERPKVDPRYWPEQRPVIKNDNQHIGNSEAHKGIPDMGNKKEEQYEVVYFKSLEYYDKYSNPNNICRACVKPILFKSIDEFEESTRKDIHIFDAIKDGYDMNKTRRCNHLLDPFDFCVVVIPARKNLLFDYVEHIKAVSCITHKL